MDPFVKLYHSITLTQSTNRIQISSVLCVLICVCVCACVQFCRASQHVSLCSHHLWLRYWAVSKPQDPSCCPFIIIPASLQPAPPSPRVTKPWQSFMYPPSLHFFFSLLNCYINTGRIMQYITFGDWHFHSAWFLGDSCKFSSRAIVGVFLLLSSFPGYPCAIVG